MLNFLSKHKQVCSVIEDVDRERLNQTLQKEKKIDRFFKRPDNAQEKQWTYLFHACKYASAEIVEELIQAGADINLTDSAGKNSLYWAACNDREDWAVEIVQLLLEKKLDCNHQANGGRTALFGAISTQNTETIEYLLEFGADPNLKAENEMSALHFAVLAFTDFNILQVTNLLLNHDADPNLARDDGLTPIFYAAELGSVELAEVLIEANANINHEVKLPDGVLVKPLDFAVMHDQQEVAGYLLSKNAEYDENITQLEITVNVEEENMNYSELKPTKLSIFMSGRETEIISAYGDEESEGAYYLASGKTQYTIDFNLPESASPALQCIQQGKFHSKIHIHDDLDWSGSTDAYQTGPFTMAGDEIENSDDWEAGDGIESIFVGRWVQSIRLEFETGESIETDDESCSDQNGKIILSILEQCADVSKQLYDIVLSISDILALVDDDDSLELIGINKEDWENTEDQEVKNTVDNQVRDFFRDKLVDQLVTPLFSDYLGDDKIKLYYPFDEYQGLALQMKLKQPLSYFDQEIMAATEERITETLRVYDLTNRQAQLYCDGEYDTGSYAVIEYDESCLGLETYENECERLQNSLAAQTPIEIEISLMP